MKCRLHKKMCAIYWHNSERKDHKILNDEAPILKISVKQSSIWFHGFWKKSKHTSGWAWKTLISVKYAVSDHFRWSYVSARRNKLKIHDTDVWNSLSSDCSFEIFEKSSVRLSNDCMKWFLLSRADKWGTFFKREAFTFSSASLIKDGAY